MASLRDRITDRLRDTRTVPDPARAALDGLPADIDRSLFPQPLVPAAVLIPLVLRDPRMSLLLTRRTDHLRDHPGQISFPGGRVEAGDASPLVTALRETEEEIGLAAGQVEIAGVLPPHPVITGFAVTPVVGFIAPGFELRLDAFEVAEAFEVPLEYFLDPDHRVATTRRIRGIEVSTCEYQCGLHRIWGATAAIIDTFISIII